MSRYIVTIDATELPDLLKVAEEVKITQTPRLIKRHGDTLALLMPEGAAGKQRSDRQKYTIWTHYNPAHVKAALKLSAGALQEVNREELLGDLAKQREQKSTGRLF